MIIKKGEIRAIVNPKFIRHRLKRLGCRRVNLYEGADFYFDRKLFEKGYHLRVRRQAIFYPRKESQYFLDMKIHEPNFRLMNVYKTLRIQTSGSDITRRFLRKLGYKEIFIEHWNRCEQFEINGLKVELFYLSKWNWLAEVEGIISKSNSHTYKKLLSVANLLGISEENLTIVEPATYLFNKKFKLA